MDNLGVSNTTAIMRSRKKESVSKYEIKKKVKHVFIDLLVLSSTPWPLINEIFTHS